MSLGFYLSKKSRKLFIKEVNSATQLEGLKVETWASCFLLKHFFIVC